MTPDRAALEAAHCWFDTDRVTGSPEMTEFKRTARWRQHQWARAQGLALGQHERQGVTYPNGSKIAETPENRLANFLSEAIVAAVEHRLSTPEPDQTLNERRLRYDLLSSMPMCFNLFGEIAQDPERAARTASLLCGSDRGPTEVRFEHSPGRRQADYLGDRTAFDVALLVGNPDSPRAIIGVETKYHEHAAAEAIPDRERRLPRYREVAETSEVFTPGWDKHVLGSPLQQLWRDHLLVLAMLQHPDGQWSDGRYVLVHPERNRSFAELAARYREVLRDDATFDVRTVEELVDSDVLHGSATAQRFRDRYLW
jgi:hypothetical protein